MPDLHLGPTEKEIVIDDRIRGFPAGHAPMALGDLPHQGWRPYDGIMSLPLLSLDVGAFRSNAAWMMRYASEHGLKIAPHAKTPMSPALASSLIRAGAWGTTVADIRQASVMLRAGLTRLIIANEVGGAAAARRLAAMLANHRDAEIHIFADSLATAAALQAAWQGRGDLPRLGILVEVGAARGGARTQAAAEEIIDFVLSQETRTFVLSGVAAYEGAAATADPQETAGRIASLMALTKTVYLEIRQRVGVARPLIVTAGGSVYFDMVVKALAPAIGRDENASLILRSGAIFFHDHGTYERGLAALDARAGFEFNGSRAKASEVFQPALRVWAEVLSQPQARIAVCGMGLRDVANDQGVPRALARYRGHQRRTLHDVVVDRLNDQHAFVAFGDAADLQVGDVIEFGLSHPCTCLDRHAVVYGLDETMTVSAVFLTSFG